MTASRLLSLVAALVLCCSAAGAFEEPRGFGKATFGMPADEVRKLLPQAVPLSPGEQLGASAISGPDISRMVLRNYTVEGLPKPTTVELRFWKHQLWGVIVYFGDNTDAEVTALLDKQFGPSDSTDPKQLLWIGATTQTTATFRQRWYGSNDQKLSKEAQIWFMNAIKGGHGHGPAATPAPAAK
ncbi:MAG: hypothetical protein ACRERC_14745 [Candidatus Binatia bacterium]